MIVCFVDIDGIVDCLNFLFIIQSIFDFDLFSGDKIICLE